MGFGVVEWKKIGRNEISAAYDHFLSKRDNYDFELDGVVFRTDDLAEQDRLGITAHHPRYAIAYKFQGDSGTTQLIDVEWSVSRLALSPLLLSSNRWSFPALRYGELPFITWES